ncbi:MAG: hypothetical protein KJ892_18645, partial [Gammaproteobacteria bacterium]|nr:hypothetical protein [Gammaproteobacteria bacterium]
GGVSGDGDGVLALGNLPSRFPRTSRDAVSASSAGIPTSPDGKTPPRRAVRASAAFGWAFLPALMGDFPPSHQPDTFGGWLPTAPPAAVSPVLSSSQLPAFIGWAFVTTTGSSATSHATAFLESRLERPRLDVKKTTPRAVQGFPG